MLLLLRRALRRAKEGYILSNILSVPPSPQLQQVRENRFSAAEERRVTGGGGHHYSATKEIADRSLAVPSEINCESSSEAEMEQFKRTREECMFGSESSMEAVVFCRDSVGFLCCICVAIQRTNLSM
ncbi:hypothetical protein CDAR_572211 [Caerostris darwini]|uniref:Uncharacterized protein n=1 Tax=Caerostris darwini TaxID=1538125 RepID=A0AAV4NVR0_9ARAC|nr:hypothetical protein CDAR_572211 [Caerostris darwini]